MSSSNIKDCSLLEKIGVVVSIILFFLTIPIVIWIMTALSTGMAGRSSSGGAPLFLIIVMSSIGIFASLISHLIIGKLIANIIIYIGDKTGMSNYTEQVIFSKYKMGPNVKTHVGSAIFGIISIVLFSLYGWDGVHALTAKVDHLFLFKIVIPLWGDSSLDVGHLFSLLTGFLSILFIFLIAGVSFGAVVVALLELLFTTKNGKNLLIVLVLQSSISFSLNAGELNSSQLFKTQINSPSAIVQGDGTLYVSSVKDRTIYKLDTKTGEIKNRLKVPAKLKVTALGYFKSTLYIGVIEDFEEAIYKIKKNRFLKVKSNIRGYIRDFDCNDTGCLITADKPFFGTDFNLLKQIDKLRVTKGIFSEKGHLLLKSFDQEAIFQHGNSDSKFGKYGSCEDEFIYPKAVAALKDGMVAISDVGLRKLLIYKVSGEYIGKITLSKDNSGFIYPIDLSSNKNDIIYLADYLGHAVYGIKAKFTKTPIESCESKTPKNFDLVRCLNCHDGSEMYSLETFTSNRNHHPVQVAYKGDAMDLPLKDGMVTCSSCHSEHHIAQAGMVIDNRGKKSQGILQKYLRKNGNDLCATCHNDQAKPSNNHVNMNSSKGYAIKSCLQCHQMHSGTDYLLNGNSSNCLNCHENSKPKSHPFGGSKKGINIECTYCHTIHGSSIASSFTIKNGTGQSSCYKCHGEITSESKANKHIKMGFDCTVCHNPHKGKSGPMQSCKMCHSDKSFNHISLSSMSSMTKGVSLTNGKISCSTCHSQHNKEGSEKMVRKSKRIKKLCKMCHGSNSSRLFEKFHSKGK